MKTNEITREYRDQTESELANLLAAEGLEITYEESVGGFADADWLDARGVPLPPVVIAKNVLGWIKNDRADAKFAQLCGGDELIASVRGETQLTSIK